MHGAHACSIVHHGRLPCHTILNSWHAWRRADKLINKYIIIRAHACVHADIGVCAHTELDVETFSGVDGGASGHGYRGCVGVQLECETALEHCKCNDGFEKGELVADAFAPAATKRQVCKVGG